MSWRAVMVLGCAALCGCAAAASGPGAAPPEASPAVAAASDTLVPAGFGTLRQDEVTVSIRSSALLVKATPLAESVIRLLAPDTHKRLSVLRDSRQAEASMMMTGEPELFLVSFFSYQPDVVYQPEDLQIVYQSRLLRPAGIIPVTTGWGRQRLDQQETQTAIYAFDTDIDYGQVFTVRYGLQQSEEWRRILARLENERGRILSRIR